MRICDWALVKKNKMSKRAEMVTPRWKYFNGQNGEIVWTLHSQARYTRAELETRIFVQVPHWQSALRWRAVRDTRSGQEKNTKQQCSLRRPIAPHRLSHLKNCHTNLLYPFAKLVYRRVGEERDGECCRFLSKQLPFGQGQFSWEGRSCEVLSSNSHGKWAVGQSTISSHYTCSVVYVLHLMSCTINAMCLSWQYFIVTELV